LATRIGLEPCGFDTSDRTYFVVVAYVAGNADRTEKHSASVAYQYTARSGHYPPATRPHDGREEIRVLRRKFGYGA
jgi:hypothetical protein